MTAVTDAIEAGARAVHALRENDGPVMDGVRIEAEAIIAAAWPVLSAPLRELHERVEFEWPRGSYYCLECYRASEDAPDWPCATIRLIEQTDKELGCG